MKKRNYRAKKVNNMNWEKIKESLSGDEIMFALDIAKEKQYALLSNQANTVSELLWWSHPTQTGQVLQALEGLGCPVTVVMESTSTYGDAIRYQFKRLGYDIYQASAKRVRDAQEIYDGVPSSHDAKAATIIMRMHRDKLTRPWRELTEQERHLNALRREYDLHQSQYQRNQNRLEAYLSRHWPEMCGLLALDSVTLENILVEYGPPEGLAADTRVAAHKIRAWGKSRLDQEKIERVISSACHTLGVPCTEAERRYLQSLAKEMRHSRLQKKAAKSALEALIDGDDMLKEMGRLIGRVTTAVLLSCHLDPRNFSHARCYQKAMGLNLKEKSSGRQTGQLKITKRGSGIARKYLYWAVLRLIRNHPVVRQWYENKVNPHARNKTVTALMRKLSKALWYVGRGECFDAHKLFTVK